MKVSCGKAVSLHLCPENHYLYLSIVHFTASNLIQRHRPLDLADVDQASFYDTSQSV
jgi:hypothetical protein